MAERAGVRAFTINSENRDDWEEISSAIERDEVDLLLVSPDRFNNPVFRADVLPTVRRVQLRDPWLSATGGSLNGHTS